LEKGTVKQDLAMLPERIRFIELMAEIGDLLK